MIPYFYQVFGVYLLYHFISIISFSEETFGNDMPYDPQLSPFYGIFPNILDVLNISFFIGGMCAFSVAFIFDADRKFASLVLWYGWACLLNRNIFISNPGIPYVGWILLVIAIVPDTKYAQHRLLFIALFLLYLGYTISGIHKLQCDSWWNGTALKYVLSGPLARDHWVVDTFKNFLLEYPILLNIMTYSGLALEILALPLGLFYRCRKVVWWSFIMFHLGIILTVNFTDLTLGVIMIHLFTYEQNVKKSPIRSQEVSTSIEEDKDKVE